MYSHYYVGEKNWRRIKRQWCPPGVIGTYYKTAICKMEGIIFASLLEDDLFNTDPNFDVNLLGNVQKCLFISNK